MMTILSILKRLYGLAGRFHHSRRGRCVVVNMVLITQRESFEPGAYINHILYLSPLLGVLFVISVVSLFEPVSSTFSSPLLS